VRISEVEVGQDETTNTTAALRRHEAEAERLLGFVSFLGGLITHADEAASKAAEFLLKYEAPEEEERRRLEDTTSGRAGARRTMQERYAQLATQLVFQRLIDNFLSYISDLLRLIFATRPEALRSSETVRLEEILRYETMDELMRFLVERRVERLAYLSVRDLASDLSSLLGVKLFEEAEELQKTVELVAIRNLVAHNRGVVNARFLRLVPTYRKSEGEEIWLDADDYFEATEFLDNVARRIDEVAIAHFHLAPGERVEPTET